MEHQIDVEINAAPERMWATLTAVEQWPEWNPTAQRVRVLDDGAPRAPSEPGPSVTLGTRARIKQPRLPAAIWRVTELDQGRGVFTWRSGMPWAASTGEHRLSPGAGGTTTVTLAIRHTGALSPVTGRLFSGMMRRNLRLEADGLKRRCEG